jgi:uncharacterized repeat protein (TIGR02543 family)
LFVDKKRRIFTTKKNTAMKNSFVLAAALLFLCAGCGSADNTSAGEGTGTGADTTKTQPTPPPPPTKFTLTYDLTGGSGSFAPVVADSGDVVSAPAGNPDKPAHCFTGWFADSAATAAFDFGTPVRRNLTVYAGWKKQHTVTLLNAGDGPQHLPVCDGDTVLLAVPAKDNVSFVGWYGDSTYSVRFGSIGQLRSDTVLYARWINGIKVNAEADGYSCNGINNPFVFFVAYEDEDGTYSNKIKEKSSVPLWDEEYNYYNVTGRNYTGGEADAACRSKGNGWYLPSQCEFSSMKNATALLFQPLLREVAYWNAGTGGDGWSDTYEMFDGWSALDTDRNDRKHKVRCVWRP